MFGRSDRGRQGAQTPEGKQARLRASLLLACGLGVLQPTRAAAVADWEPEPQWPGWIKPTAVSVPEAEPNLAFFRCERSTRHMKKGVGQLWYCVTRLKTSPNRPFWYLKLGQHFIDLECDHEGYYVLRRTLKLKDDTPYNSGIQGLPSVRAVKREARFLLARTFARNGLRDAASEELGGLLPARNGYDHVRIAEIHALLGQPQEAYQALEQSRGGGHPEANFSDVFLRMRAVVLARTLGNDELALRLAEPMLAKELTTQKWPQWRSAWSIVRDTAENAKSGRAAFGRKPRPGTYLSGCRGFVAPIGVTVNAKAGKVADVVIDMHREDRVWSSLSAVPTRIVRRQSLVVDAVTGATVTSCAIIVAVDSALIAAQK